VCTLDSDSGEARGKFGFTSLREDVLDPDFGKTAAMPLQANAASEIGESPLAPTIAPVKNIKARLNQL